MFSIETFHLMQERGWLPEAYDSYRLNYELDPIISLYTWHHQRMMQLPIAGMIQLHCGIQTVETERKLCAMLGKDV